MSVAPHAGIVDFGTFTSPSTTVDGIQGEVPQPLAGQQDYVLTANGFVPGGSIPGLGTMATQNANAVAITGGTIDNTTIGATTPSTVNATTITGQTGVLRGTGQNLILQSQTFTNAAWTKTAVTATASGATAPDSTSTAITILETTANSAHNFFPTTSLTTSSGALYTISVYVKANGRNFCAIYDSSSSVGKYFNITAGGGGSVLGNLVGAPVSAALVYVGNDWYRASIVVTAGATIFPSVFLSPDGTSFSYTGNASLGIFAWGFQLELGSTANTYIPTTTTAVYGTPTLSFSGVSTIGLESTGSLFVQPAGTGALQAQATTSTTAGGNARGSNAVDWQTFRSTSAARVASGAYAAISGGINNSATGYSSITSCGDSNQSTNTFSFMGGGASNTSSGYGASIVGGYTNTAAGYFNFIGGGSTNSGTALAAVTTQSGTMNATTAVTLSGSNANIKVGQLIVGTSINNFPNTYVAAISGTSLTLSQAASGSSTSTLSFFTPHGVVVGGGNNQATGSYSFIGGGGDAGTASQRNVASGDWSVVCGGTRHTASGLGSFIGGGGTYAPFGTFPHTASGVCASIVGGFQNTASGQGAFVGGGYNNTANSLFSAIISGEAGTTRSIIGNHVFPACSGPISASQGVQQSALLVLGVQTTDATATALRSNNSAAGTTNQVILPNNAAYYFKGSCIANVTGAANGAAWSFEGAIMRGANAASTVLIDTPSVNRVAASSGATTWTIALTADTTNGGLTVTVTGVASTTIRWVAKVETTEVTF